MPRILLATCCSLAVALFAALPIASSAQATAAPSASPAASAAPTMSNDEVQQLALNILTQLQNAHIDHSLFNDATNAQLTDDYVLRLSPQLTALGQPQAMFLSKTDLGGGVSQYTFLLRSGAGKFDEIISLDSNNKVAGINFQQDFTH